MAAADGYARNREWANHFRGLYSALNPHVTSAVDIKDMLRASIVFSVSAFDALIHDCVIDGFAQIFDGHRTATDSYRQHRKNAAERFAVPRTSLTSDQMITHIRERNELISFQSVSSVGAALRSIGIQDIWQIVGDKRGVDVVAIQSQFEVVIQRRHLIVHQADILPVLGGYRNDIDEEQAMRTDQVLGSLADDIIAVLN